MIQRVYAIYDKVAEESSNLFECKNDGVALREFQKLVLQTAVPDDYQLFYIGQFDHTTNQMRIEEVPVLVDVSLNESKEMKNE